MWISGKEYQSLREDYIRANEEAKVLNRQIAAYETTLDWFRVRITQLELERSALMNNYLGVNIPAPIIAKKSEESPYHAVPHFGDIGDAEAAKLGITWNADGSVSYPDQK